MYYIWTHRLFDRGELITTHGSKVQVIDPGRQNSDAGPDFFNAKVRIAGKLWAGNVEIHRRSSDWLKHDHHKDRAYDSVILHVVEIADTEIYRTNGEAIPQLEMKCSPDFHKDYDCLVNHTGFLSCRDKLGEIEPIWVSDWITALSMERLQQKTERILSGLEQYRGSWEDVCYLTLSRNLGFNLNSDTFERLARSLPLLFLKKHADSLIQVEAFLFGQAGFLDEQLYVDDVYFQHLAKEYQFLRNKFGLSPIEKENWKFLRLRPANFPHQRIAALAQLIHNGFSLFSRICEIKEEKEFRKLFDIRLSGYWDTHYSFGQSSPFRSKVLGSSAIDILLINTVAPLLYAYGIKVGEEKYMEVALSLLEELKPERNTIIQQFGEVGLRAVNALDSQALIQLHKEYCVKKKCLYCRIGHRILAKTATI